MNALIVSHITNAILIIVIAAAAGAGFGSNVLNQVINAAIALLLTLWWRSDIQKFVQAKKDVEA
jgi:hypothetical protein